MTKLNVDDVIEPLAFLLCGDQEDFAAVSDANNRHHRIDPRGFDGFEVYTREDEEVLLGKSVTDFPVWPVDVCFAAPAGEDWPDGTWKFDKLKTLSTKEWRGKITAFTPKMIERHILISQPNGVQKSVKIPISISYGSARVANYNIGGFRQVGMSQWAVNPAWYGRNEFDPAEDDCTDLVKIICGASLRRRYLWSVLIGEGVGPRARFVTDPVGVRAAFRLRDIPPGRQRRTALLHWVREHWRQKGRESEADKAWIRAHLRGVWSYTWNGLRCQIDPATFDMEKATLTPPPA